MPSVDANAVVMTLLDVCILIVLALGALRGLFKGFVAQAVALISIFLGTWLAFRFSNMLAAELAPRFDAPEAAVQVVSFVIIVVLVIIVLWFVGKLIKGLVKIVLLGWVDRLLGAVFGILSASLVVGILIMLFTTIDNTFHLTSPGALDSDTLYQTIKNIAYSIFPYFKEVLFK